MNHALIGYTGFVGGTLLRQHPFEDLYNSRNIEAIAGHEYELLVCAGAPAAKWRANKEPAEDRATLDRLEQAMARCSARELVLISTIDVYPLPQGVDEDTPIAPGEGEPYGRHRYALECFARENFARTHVIRLPALFGAGLKKNFIYDLLNQQCLDWTHADSVFQFYDLERLWPDCERVLESRLEVVNLATEPIAARTIAARCFDVSFDNATEKPPAAYDMRTRHAPLFGAAGPYIAGHDEVLDGISRFVGRERKGRT